MLAPLAHRFCTSLLLVAMTVAPALGNSPRCCQGNRAAGGNSGCCGCCQQRGSVDEEPRSCCAKKLKPCCAKKQLASRAGTPTAKSACSCQPFSPPPATTEGDAELRIKHLELCLEHGDISVESVDVSRAFIARDHADELPRLPLLALLCRWTV